MKVRVIEFSEPIHWRICAIIFRRVDCEYRH